MVFLLLKLVSKMQPNAPSLFQLLQYLHVQLYPHKKENRGCKLVKAFRQLPGRITRNLNVLATSKLLRCFAGPALVYLRNAVVESTIHAQIVFFREFLHGFEQFYAHCQSLSGTEWNFTW